MHEKRARPYRPPEDRRSEGRRCRRKPSGRIGGDSASSGRESIWPFKPSNRLPARRRGRGRNRPVWRRNSASPRRRVVFEICRARLPRGGGPRGLIIESARQASSLECGAPPNLPSVGAVARTPHALLSLRAASRGPRRPLSSFFSLPSATTHRRDRRVRGFLQLIKPLFRLLMELSRLETWPLYRKEPSRTNSAGRRKSWLSFETVRLYILGPDAVVISTRRGCGKDNAPFDFFGFCLTRSSPGALSASYVVAQLNFLRPRVPLG